MAIEEDIGIGTRIFGFKNGSRQFHRLLKINLPRIHSFDQTAATNLLMEVFAMEPEDIEPPRNQSGKKPTSDELAYLTCALSLARALMRSAGLPSFERERIIEFPTKSATKHRIVRMEVPVVERMPALLYLNCYMTAFRLLAEFTKPMSQRSSLKKQADEIESSLIDPIKRKGNVRPLDIFVLKEAFERGIQICHYGSAIYRLGTGSQAYVFSRSSTERDAAIGFRIARDKTMTQDCLRLSGIPTPRSIPVSTVRQAQKAADEIGYPVVIKPSDRDRSEGVSVDVGSAEAVQTAFRAAKKWSDNILVEERIPGVCHRLVTFRNKFVFAFTRHPKAVVGDGQKTVAELVEAANRKRARQAKHVREKEFPLDEEALGCLASQGLRPSAVPEKDRIVLLRLVNSPESGGYHEIVTEKVHPENIELAERISRLMRLESMGLDLISTDVAKPWYETAACVTEVNATPQIGTNSARIYLDMTFDDRKGFIPVHCLVGDDAAMDQARLRREEIEKAGLSAYLTSGTESMGSGGLEIILASAEGLFDRTSVLLNDPKVDALILVVQDDEFMIRGLPTLAFASVEVVNESLCSFRDSEQWLSAGRVNGVIDTLKAAIDGTSCPSAKNIES